MKPQSILRAQFMHQHKDKVMYEQTLLYDRVFISSNREGCSVIFELPIIDDCPTFFHKMRPFNAVYTEREVRLGMSDSDTVKLDTRIFAASLIPIEDSAICRGVLRVSFNYITKDEIELLFNLLTK